MTYEQALEYTHSLLRFGIQPGLERIEELLKRLGNPQCGLRVIHVAGTNGKGSTCAMLSSILRRAKYRTGLFLSPYVLDFRERIQLDGEMIPKDEFASLASEVRKQAECMAELGRGPTEFEFITAVAFVYFHRQNCDAVVLETGLGGRFDSTNVIERPLASVITSISLDHTDILGDTIEQIALEKAGIMKKNGLCVTCPDQNPAALGVLMQRAAEQNARLCIPSFNAFQILHEGLEGTDVLWKERCLHIPFCGRFQLSNALCAIETAERIVQQGLAVSDEAIRDGIAGAFLPARMEQLSRDPLILLDGTHNPGGASSLAQLLRTHLGEGKAVAVWGMLRDKNYEAVVQTLAPFFSFVYTVAPENPRALPAEDLARCFTQYDVPAVPAQVSPKLIDRAVAQAAGAPVLILGSLYLAAQIRPIVEGFLQEN